MKANILVVKQLDNKLKLFENFINISIPDKGWIKAIRTALNMSLRQLGKRMSITPQSVSDIEQREKAGTLTLKTLQDAATALDMKMVYCFIPKEGTIEEIIDRKASEMATQIVLRTSATMSLEDQKNTDERLQKAIKELSDEIKRELPKKLWD